MRNLDYMSDRRMSLTVSNLSGDDVRLISVLAEVLKHKFEIELISANVLEDLFWLIEVLEDAARIALEMDDVIVQEYQRAKYAVIDAFLNKWREDHAIKNGDA